MDKRNNSLMLVQNLVEIPQIIFGSYRDLVRERELVGLQFADREKNSQWAYGFLIEEDGKYLMHPKIVSTGAMKYTDVRNILHAYGNDPHKFAGDYKVNGVSGRQVDVSVDNKSFPIQTEFVKEVRVYRVCE
jgi:hypothetical protein